MYFLQAYRLVTDRVSKISIFHAIFGSESIENFLIWRSNKKSYMSFYGAEIGDLEWPWTTFETPVVIKFGSVARGIAMFE